MDAIRTLQQAIIHFSDEDNCIAYMVKQRWPDGIVTCPTCGRNDVSWLKVQKKWQCKSKHAKRQFSAKVGTIFEDSPLGLDKWLMTSWMLVNCKNGISSYEIARNIGVTQKSAWFMLQRLRLAMKTEPESKLGGDGGVVEADECFIGGKPKNKHLGKRSGEDKKAIVMGMKDRSTREIRAKVIPNVKRESLHAEIMKNIGKGTTIYTDGWLGYQHLQYTESFVHETVNHVDQYVKGQVHTQGIENFWSLLKRTLNGTYVAVEPFHLDRYVDEQVFRFNTSKSMNDGQRFNKVLSKVAGKRLTYAEVTGKVGQTAF